MNIISENLNNLFNEQIAHEYYNANLYQKISSYFEQEQLHGLSKYFADHSVEERGHAKRFINFIESCLNGRVEIFEIPQVETEFNSLQSVADAYLKQELLTTDMIDNLYSIAQKEGFSLSYRFLLEMIDEQNSEINEADTFVKQAKRINENGIGLELLDMKIVD